MNAITRRRINLLLALTFCILLRGEVMAFQQPHFNTNTKRCSSIYKSNGVVTSSLVSTNIGDDATEATTIKNQMTNMFLSSAFGMCLISSSLITTPQLANAIEQADINMGIRNTGTALI